MNQLVLDIAEHDIDDSEVPISVLSKTVKKKEKRASARKSNFLITANPNISWRALTDNQVKMRIAKKLIAFCKNVEINLRNHKLMKEFATAGYQFPDVSRFEFAIEMERKMVSYMLI